MLTYADTVTLLMTFFVLLMTFRGADAQRFRDIASGIRASFTLFDTSPGDSAVEPPQAREGQRHQGGVETAPTYDALRDVEADFRICLESPGMADYVDFTNLDRGLLIRIRPGLLFDPGSAEIKSANNAVLNAIATSLRKLPHVLRVTAHGDRFFLPTSRHETNQELAMDRAAAICHYLATRGQISAPRLQSCASASGLGSSGSVVEIMVLTTKPGGFHL